MRRIDEVRMCRAEVSGELVQSVVSNKDTGRDVQHAVFSIEVLNGGAAAGRVTFAKDFLKVAVQKLNNSITRRSIPCPRASRRLRWTAGFDPNETSSCALLSGCQTALLLLETLSSCAEGRITL
jgi:hypothetical protein